MPSTSTPLCYKPGVPLPARFLLFRRSIALALAAAVLPAVALPSFDEVRRDFRSSETVMQRVRSRGQWTALADVSPALRTALVLSEDRRFCEHSGVDWRAATATAWGSLWHERTAAHRPSPCSSPACSTATGGPRPTRYASKCAAPV
ncbi:MAG: Monofunctional biosynthetic peptidoglycan transglycosylase [Xylophilus sp.]|nr:MAG: Monofunctional biosynthetic peptidoglycan transglycosylase [Xylophilus sp.]